MLKEVKVGWEMRKNVAQARQREAQRLSREFPARSIDGLGQPILEVAPEVYNYWIRREGKEFWKEKSNLRYFRRHHDEMGSGNYEKKPQITV